MSEPFRVGLVCLGNICRSAMAEVVLTRQLADAGLAERVQVVSGGTGDFHVGEPMDERAAAVLRAGGYDADRHRAQQVDRDWLEGCDLVLVMDTSNYAGVTGLGEAARVRMFRDFDPEVSDPRQDRDVPDPYYGGPDGFVSLLAMVERTGAGIVADLAEATPGQGPT